MATETVPNANLGAPPLTSAFIEARHQVGSRAAYEVGAIANMLRREAAADVGGDFDILLGGALVRLDNLSIALSQMMGVDADKPEEIAAQYAVVFGKALEVSHG